MGGRIDPSGAENDPVQVSRRRHGGKKCAAKQKKFIGTNGESRDRIYNRYLNQIFKSCDTLSQMIVEIGILHWTARKLVLTFPCVEMTRPEGASEQLEEKTDQRFPLCEGTEEE